MSNDPLAIMIRENKVRLAHLDPCNADEREAVLQMCGETLAAIKDPMERMSCATNYAILLAIRCTMPDSTALAAICHQTEDDHEDGR